MQKGNLYEFEHYHGLPAGHPVGILNLRLIEKLRGVFKDMLGKQDSSCL